MKRLFALFVVLCMLLSSMFTLFSCTDEPAIDTDGTTDDGSKDNGDDVDGEGDGSQGGSTSTIIVPEYKDYNRGTENFDALSYTRPNITSLCEAFDAVTSAIEQNTLTPEEQLDMILAIEDDYSECLTMYYMAQIYTYKDSSAVMWATEYEYISTALPTLSQSIADMYVAAARSEHVEFFEENYFGEGLYEEYYDGSIYTDAMVEFLAAEAEYESEYHALSTSTVEITYQGKTGTLDEMIAYAGERWSETSTNYIGYVETCYALYELAVLEKSCDIYVELVKVRRQIADEAGYDTYANIAYEELGYDYSISAMKEFIGNVKNYIYPVYKNLYSTVFGPYFHITSSPPSVGREKLINTLYSVYKSKDSDLADAYAYMLQHGLYDVSLARDNRYDGAFTVYLYDNNSPFLFMTTSKSVKDYSSLSHEFGHFYDGFVNSTSNQSLELAEVSSQALEFLTLNMLSGSLSTPAYKYLTYYMYSNALEVLLFQGFYSMYEHLVYELEYEEINKDRLTQLVEDASAAVFGDVLFDNMNVVMVPHLVVQPMYVQSYCTSIVAALEIYFMELDEASSGITVYKALIDRNGSSLTFVQTLEGVGLTSPFKSGVLKNTANKIYYKIYGKNYFTNSGNNSNVA